MMTEKYNEDIPACDLCGALFSNGFDYVDHMMEDDEEFNPYLLLPNGYRLMVGAVLRTLFENADDPDTIRQVCESTYMTLYTAETAPHLLDEVITDLIVESSVADLDDSLRRILENGE
jgi:hypothetical protein